MIRSEPLEPREDRSWERLILVGFMGAGKSTVGALLASRLNLPFVDADIAIEKQTARTIAQLFEERGEPEFRRLEEEAVAKLLSGGRAVIALGGGALESPATRKLLSESENICVVHLEAPLQTMLDRCRESAPTRPLLRDEQSLIDRHARRLEHYRSADVAISTEGLAADAVVEELLRRLPAGSALMMQSPLAEFEAKASEAADV